MAKRKTYDVATIRQSANDYFYHSEDDKRDARRALQSFVENILMKTGNYKGFSYRDAKGSKPGNSIGIIFDESPARDHKFPDDSRIFFYE